MSPTTAANPSAPGGATTGVPGRSVIEEAKAKVETVALAELLCGGPGSNRLRRVGDRLVARCPLPDHEDRTPSFTVYTETNSWYCFGACQRGGDVVELARFAWRIERADVAAAEVLLSFGHEIPPRPAAWFARQERQAPVRDRIEEARIEHVRDLVFRIIWLPWLRALPAETREAVAQDAWEKSRTLATMVWERRRSQGA